MQTDSLNVVRRLFLDVILRTRGALCDNGRSVTVQDMCAEMPRRFVPKQEQSWQFGEVMKRWEWFHQPRGRIRIVSLVCLVMVSLTLHILSGWLLRPLFVSANISVLGVVCFSVQGSYFSQHVFEGPFCGSDARCRHGRDWFVSC